MTTILVVEDDEHLRTDVVQILGFENYQTLSAPDAESAIRQIQENPPDLVVCDIGLPDRDGYAVLDELRRHAHTHTPLIFLTARAEKQDMRYGMELGADDYLTKPFQMHELLGAVRTQLEKSESISRLANLRRDQLARDIIRNIPHEMRTPLTAIIGYAELIERSADRYDPFQLKEYGQNIRSAAVRLHRLINRYVTYVSLETANVREDRIQLLHADRVPTPDEFVVYHVQHLAERMGRESDLVVTSVACPPLWISDGLLLTLLEELVDNAFKFTRHGQSVIIDLRPKEGGAVLTIADSGEGLPAGALSEAGPFVQFGREEHEQQGAGLGLAIAREIVRLYDGRFELESSKERGTWITIFLQEARQSEGIS